MIVCLFCAGMGCIVIACGCVCDFVLRLTLAFSWVLYLLYSRWGLLTDCLRGLGRCV